MFFYLFSLKEYIIHVKKSKERLYAIKILIIGLTMFYFCIIKGRWDNPDWYYMEYPHVINKTITALLGFLRMFGGAIGLTFIYLAISVIIKPETKDN